MKDAFARFEAQGHGGWTRGSIEAALKTACPRSVLGGAEAEYERGVREDALAVLAAVDKGAEDVLSYAEFLEAAAAIDAVIARRLGRRG